MTRTGQAAIDYARSRVGTYMPDSGLCLQFVRTCFDVPSYYYSAIDAWNGSPTKHPGDRNPPPAVPLYFLSPSPYDHVVFCCSSGEIISTFNDEIRSYSSISQVEAVFDGSYLGWCEDINRVDIWDEGEDDDMPTAQEVADAVWGYALQRPNGPVADAGSYLVDSRVLLGDPSAPLVRVADQVWSAQLARPNGPPVDAGTYLVDTRASVAPVTAGPVLVADQVWEGVPAVASKRTIGALAVLIILAVIGGVALAYAVDAGVGVAAGVGTLIGGAIAALASGWQGRRETRSHERPSS